MPIPHRYLFRILGATVLFVLAAFSVGAHQVDPANASPTALAASAVTATGTVAELLVEDQVAGVELRYLALRLDSAQTVALTGAGVEALASGARVEVTGSLSGEALAVTSFSVLPAAQVAAKSGVPTASREQVQGTLVLFHKDYFAEGRGEYGFGVHNGAAQMTPLNLAVVPDALRAGMTVIASGTTAADGVALDTTQITILGLPAEQAAPLAGVTTTNNVLVMPIKFSDSPASDPFTPAAVDQVMRTNTNSVAAYYNEVSYGQQQLNITVACATPPVAAGCAANTSSGGWLLSSSATPASCDYTTMASLGDAAATAAGYNIANYVNRFYVLPSISGCGWAGLAYVGYPYQSWSDGYNALWVYGHELGHNFTLYHAGSLNCSPQVLGGSSCSAPEYGDRFDVMGNNSTAGEQMHFDATQKSLLNWIPESAVVTQTSGTATYSISPLESPGGTIYAVKIPVAADSNRTYWIEYRQPIGFDSGIASYPNNGAIIHVSSPFDYPCTSCFGDDTEILEMTPGNAYDAALVVGQNYTDSTYGISVTVNSATASALNVTVSVGGKAASTTTLASSVNPSTVGGNVTFTATLTGNAPTGSVGFTADGSTLSGCSAVALPSGSASSKSATCSTAGLVAGTHSIVATYGGDSANSGSTSATLSQVVNKAASATTLASSLNPSTVGANVTFTATVTGSAPTGSVSFAADGTTLSGCGAVALPSGSASGKSATCSTASLVAGTHSIVATYGGNSANSGSTSATLSQVVSSSMTSSTTSLASSANPSAVGANVTFTATVTGSAPTGSVGFTADGTTLSGCSAVALPTGSASSKSATCSTASLVAGTHSIVASYSGDSANNGSTSATLSQVVTGTNVVWVENSVPTGAVLGSDGGDSWDWVSSNPTPYMGTQAHQSAIASGEHQHYFYNATATLPVAAGDTLFTYVYLDPLNLPSEVMLQWYDGSWEHRAYWGADLIGWGSDGTVSRVYMGPLPAAGQWVELAVPAAQVGLGGTTLNGMAYTLYGGRATWDYSGKSSAGQLTPTTTTLASSLNPSTVGSSVTFTATVAGSSPTGSVNFTDGGSSIAGCGAVALPTGSASSKSATCSTASLVAGTHSIVASYSGDSANNGSTSATLSQVVTGTNVVWVENSVPTGAVLGSDGGDSWDWVSSNPTPYMGTQAHQSAIASGEHQHYFYNATATLPVAAGDTLFTYVYLDPLNLPSEVMLQWNDGSWEHRAYWGADLIGWGSDGTVSRVYMGPLPAAGQWVELAVPAAQVGLGGTTLNGMAYTLYGGRATWDYSGKSSATN